MKDNDTLQANSSSSEEQRKQVLDLLDEEIVSLRHSYWGMIATCIFAVAALACFLLFCV